jgi:hypothetical protein
MAGAPALPAEPLITVDTHRLRGPARSSRRRLPVNVIVSTALSQLEQRRKVSLLVDLGGQLENHFVLVEDAPLRPVSAGK